jgi:putative transposon-encoded protein
MSILHRFNFYSHFTYDDAQRAYNIIKTAVEYKWSTREVQNVLRSEGLGYRRTNILDDYRKMKAINKVKFDDFIKQRKVLDYYENVVRPFAQSEKLKIEQAYKTIKKWEKKQYETIQEMYKIEHYASEYAFY